MESDRLIALSARNFTDWHEASLNALGVRRIGYRQVGVHTHWFHPGTITQRN